MDLVRIVELRDAVDGLCAAIDAGDVQPDERELAALAIVVSKEAGPLAHDLLVKIASRSVNGRVALKQMAH